MRGDSLNRGTYMIVLSLPERIVLEKSGSILDPGFYVYVGSAWNSLTGRLKRHLTRPKRVHWHVDELTNSADVVMVLAFPGKRIEEELSRFMAKRFESVPGFGATDLRVDSNLFKVDRDVFFSTVPDILRAFL